MPNFQVWMDVTATETRKATVEADTPEQALAQVEKLIEEVDVFAATRDTGMYGDTTWSFSQIENLDTGELSDPASEYTPEQAARLAWLMEGGR